MVCRYLINEGISRTNKADKKHLQSDFLIEVVLFIILAIWLSRGRSEVAKYTACTVLVGSVQASAGNMADEYSHVTTNSPRTVSASTRLRIDLIRQARYHYLYSYYPKVTKRP